MAWLGPPISSTSPNFGRPDRFDFDSTTPAATGNVIAITGVTGTILDIDQRPAVVFNSILTENVRWDVRIPGITSDL